MSIRQYNLGSIVKPGFNPLGAPTPSYTYYMWSWGSNASGQLGLGNTTGRSSPVQVGALGTWTQVSIILNSSLAIGDSNKLYAWGSGSSGILGLGNTSTYSSPKQVGALTNWSQISVGGGNGWCIAVKTDGTLWSWGNSSMGELGLGNTTAYSSPKQIGALATWSQIATGKYHSIAVKTDGTLWSWGRNYEGQLGLGTSGLSTDKSSPNQVGALTNWLKISCGSYHNIAVKTDGTLWSWGANSDGRLGDGTTTDRSSPVQVGALTTWSTIGTSATSSFGIATSGTLWAWGGNTQGQLAQGNTSNVYSSPKQIGALTTWSVVNGFFLSCSAIKTDGTLWSWGFNAEGQLGLGNLTYYSSPKQVGALTSWGSLATMNQARGVIAFQI